MNQLTNKDLEIEIRKDIWYELTLKTQSFLIAIHGSYQEYISQTDPTKNKYKTLEDVCILYDKALEDYFFAVKGLNKLGFKYDPVIPAQITLCRVLEDIVYNPIEKEKYADVVNFRIYK